MIPFLPHFHSALPNTQQTRTINTYRKMLLRSNTEADRAHQTSSTASMLQQSNASTSGPGPTPPFTSATGKQTLTANPQRQVSQTPPGQKNHHRSQRRHSSYKQQSYNRTKGGKKRKKEKEKHDVRCLTSNQRLIAGKTPLRLRFSRLFLGSKTYLPLTSPHTDHKTRNPNAS